MPNNTGWIKLHRMLQNNPMWLSEPFTRAQAWVDLLMLANHKAGKILKRGIVIEINRGQVGYSEDALALRWKWTRKKVRQFLSELTKMDQISRKGVQQNPRLTNLIDITNYEKYQSEGTTESVNPIIPAETIAEGTTEVEDKGQQNFLANEPFQMESDDRHSVKGTTELNKRGPEQEYKKKERAIANSLPIKTKISKRKTEQEETNPLSAALQKNEGDNFLARIMKRGTDLPTGPEAIQ